MTSLTMSSFAMSLLAMTRLPDPGNLRDGEDAQNQFSAIPQPVALKDAPQMSAYRWFADLEFGCDLLVAKSPENLRRHFCLLGGELKCPNDFGPEVIVQRRQLWIGADAWRK